MSYFGFIPLVIETCVGELVKTLMDKKLIEISPAETKTKIRFQSSLSVSLCIDLNFSPQWSIDYWNFACQIDWVKWANKFLPFIKSILESSWMNKNFTETWNLSETHRRGWTGREYWKLKAGKFNLSCFVGFLFCKLVSIFSFKKTFQSRKKLDTNI